MHACMVSQGSCLGLGGFGSCVVLGLGLVQGCRFPGPESRATFGGLLLGIRLSP